jgi:hypothetical protein
VFPVRSKTLKVAKSSERLESFIEEVQDIEEKEDKLSSKFQLFIGAMHLSFISRGFDRVRREFLLCYFESVEFLALENEEAIDLQLRVEYV